MTTKGNDSPVRRSAPPIKRSQNDRIRRNQRANTDHVSDSQKGDSNTVIRVVDNTETAVNTGEASTEAVNRAGTVVANTVAGAILAGEQVDTRHRQGVRLDRPKKEARKTMALGPKGVALVAVVHDSVVDTRQDHSDSVVAPNGRTSGRSLIMNGESDWTAAKRGKRPTATNPDHRTARGSHGRSAKKR